MRPPLLTSNGFLYDAKRREKRGKGEEEESEKWASTLQRSDIPFRKNGGPFLQAAINATMVTKMKSAQTPKSDGRTKA